MQFLSTSVKRCFEGSMCILPTGVTFGREYMFLDEVNFFQFTKSFQPHYGPGVDSASNSSEYQEYSWG
jgi:hypothetical protein